MSQSPETPDTNSPAPADAPTAAPITGPLELIATATFGLEAVVARELRVLGYAPRIVQAGRVHFFGSERDICRTNLWLRTADRVLVCVDRFEATDFGVLFDRTRAIEWEKWLAADAVFPVTGRSIKSQLSSVPACQKIVKKAIVERLKAAYGLDWCPETGAGYSIEVALLDNLATLVIDTTGPGLHKRGYRPLTGKAPLKETLAAALIQLSVWRPERPLVDPFCGTGTIPIEAALIGRNKAPGLDRAFAAEAWPRVEAGLWEATREEARAAILPAAEERGDFRIMGTDEDEESLHVARIHAEKAGVADDIHFQQKSFADLTSKRSYGVVICNPPYGERLGRPESLAPLYRAMPEVFRRLTTWSFYILTAVPDFEGLVGQPATRRRKLYNARIECTYFQFLGPKPGGMRGKKSDAVEVETEIAAPVEPTVEVHVEAPNEERIEEQFEVPVVQTVHTAVAKRQAAVDVEKTVQEEIVTEVDEIEIRETPPRVARPVAKQVFGGLSDKALRQAEDFRNRLTARARHLRRWPTKQGITCYRLYERDIPEVPLVIDRYEDCLHVAEFERPTDHTPAEHADWLDLMLRTAAEVLQLDRKNVFLKQRRRQRGADQYERFDHSEQRKIVHEGGLKFEVNLSDYLDTGLFLDHRITRSFVRQAAQGKRFLNLFAYTGSFSVYAAAGGAVETVSVDLSSTYLQWAERNMKLNGLAGPQHSFIRDDALQFLIERGPRPRFDGAKFDLAVVDVPTFSNSKRLEEDWDVQRNHVELLTRLIAMMTPGGTIFFSTNYRRFKLDEHLLQGVTIREISRQTVPMDFRNRRIHRCWRMAVMERGNGQRTMDNGQ
jgi:23S rRNA (guanine2445-N2)-methyltransferase / 23S rRNA (guanine2069-N7)-methyltransferase